MLLVIARMPALPDPIAQAAAVLGVARADVAHRLAGTLPRIVLTDANAPRVASQAAALEGAGFVAFTCEPARVPSDAARVVVRTIELEPAGFVAIDRAGARHACPASSIALFQRGTRVTTTTETVSTTERKFDIGRAALSGGLILTKKVEKTSTQTNNAREAFVVVQRNDGQPDVILYERRIDYRFLGARLQPASHGNLMQSLERLRALAPDVAVDDRVSRPGFATGQFATQADPIDLGLFLVRTAHDRGA